MVQPRGDNKANVFLLPSHFGKTTLKWGVWRFGDCKEFFTVFTIICFWLRLFSAGQMQTFPMHYFITYPSKAENKIWLTIEVVEEYRRLMRTELNQQQQLEQYYLQERQPTVKAESACYTIYSELLLHNILHNFRKKYLYHCYIII